MSEQRQDTLRVQSDAVAALRTAFSSAIDQVNDAVVALGRQGFLPEPWLGDETSNAVAAHYTARAMEAPDSSYQALLAYRDELTQIHDTLQQMEEAYRRGESDETARWGPRT